jgi:hypothetical protein
MKKTILFSLLLAAVLVSCKKKDNNCEASTATIMGKYKVTSVLYKLTPASTEIDGSGVYFIDDCQKDDILEFAANGVYNYTDAGTVCTPDGSYSSTWSFNNGILTVDGHAAQLDGFNCTSMIFSSFNEVVSGDELIVTLTRQ